MNGPADLAPRSNPFSTRWVRPGAIPYFHPAGDSCEAILARLAQHGWRGQIVGPHGTGKSTLLAELLPRLAGAGRRVVASCLHDGQRRMPPCLVESLRRGWTNQVVVDGYEQLSWWSRSRLGRLCNRHRAGLLVTCHVSRGLPTLVETRPDPAVARRVLEHLLPPEDKTVSGDDLAACFAQHGGNLRETLFGLYDLYQRRGQCDRTYPVSQNRRRCT